MNKPTRDEAKKAIRTFLEYLGEDPDRPGLAETPERVVRFFENSTYGLRTKLQVMTSLERNTSVPPGVVPITIFPVISNDLLIRKVSFHSFCEHHTLPFMGTAWVGMVPNQKLLGMNKIDKIVKYFAAKFQIQEGLGKEIVDWIQENIQPKGVIVSIEADHLCARLQGDDGKFITSAISGVFLEGDARSEFLQLINRRD